MRIRALIRVPSSDETSASTVYHSPIGRRFCLRSPQVRANHVPVERTGQEHERATRGLCPRHLVQHSIHPVAPPGRDPSHANGLDTNLVSTTANPANYRPTSAVFLVHAPGFFKRSSGETPDFFLPTLFLCSRRHSERVLESCSTLRFSLRTLACPPWQAPSHGVSTCGLNEFGFSG